MVPKAVYISKAALERNAGRLDNTGCTLTEGKWPSDRIAKVLQT